ncbi:MAG: hypothetical protein KF678_08050 [Phycisphaeraceae bacterium]|nr:hypothetical protein [Phycisphaeraceae bacterium]
MNTETRRDGTVQLADWWEDLLWPRVMASAALGIRPSRIGLVFFGMVAALVVLWVGHELDRLVGKTGMPGPMAAVARGEGPHTALWQVIVTYPVMCVTSMPFTTALLVLVVLPIKVVTAGAVSRMAAVEFARGEFVPWTEAVGYSLRRMGSLLGAVLGPLVAVWLIALVLAAGGFVLLNWPYVNVVGGVLYGLALLLGMAASLIGVVYIAGNLMLVPAVACDGADAVDAIQRAYAYTLDRPVRLVLYLVLAAIGLGIALLILVVLVGAGIGVAYAGAGWWLGERAQAMLLHGTVSVVPGLGDAVPAPEGSYKAGSWLISLWTMIPVYGVLACALSCGVSCATVVYLAMRRICDGQDTSELWMPGEIEGVMQVSLSGRAAEVRVSAAGPTDVDDEL